MRARRIRPPAPTADKRPPMVRIESMLAEPSATRRARTWRRIHDDAVAAMEGIGPWTAAIVTLAERGVIPFEIECFMSRVIVENAFFSPRPDRQDAEIERLSAEVERIERAHGLSEDDFWYVDEGPPEWQELNKQWDARADEVIAAEMRRRCRAAVADLHERDHDEFEFQDNRGRIALLGEDPDIS